MIAFQSTRSFSQDWLGVLREALEHADSDLMVQGAFVWPTVRIEKPGESGESRSPRVLERPSCGSQSSSSLRTRLQHFVRGIGTSVIRRQDPRLQAKMQQTGELPLTWCWPQLGHTKVLGRLSPVRIVSRYADRRGSSS